MRRNPDAVRRDETELPPPNRAIGWYRLMLWLMPTCIAITTALGSIFLSNEIGWQGDFLLLFWFVFNVGSCLAIGFFEARLRQPPPRKLADAAARFVALQTLVIPVTCCALLFSLCLVGAY